MRKLQMLPMLTPFIACGSENRIACGLRASKFSIDQPGPLQSSRMPEAFTTLAHFAISLRISSATCSGVPVSGSAP